MSTYRSALRGFDYGYTTSGFGCFCWKLALCGFSGDRDDARLCRWNDGYGVIGMLLCMARPEEILIMDMDAETLREFNKTTDGVYCNMKLESLDTVASIDKFLIPVLQEGRRCLDKFISEKNRLIMKGV